MRVVVQLITISKTTTLNYLIVLMVKIFVIKFTLTPVKQGANFVGETLIIASGQVPLQFLLFDPQVLGADLCRNFLFFVHTANSSEDFIDARP